MLAETLLGGPSPTLSLSDLLDADLSVLSHSSCRADESQVAQSDTHSLNVPHTAGISTVAPSSSDVHTP